MSSEETKPLLNKNEEKSVQLDDVKDAANDIERRRRDTLLSGDGALKSAFQLSESKKGEYRFNITNKSESFWERLFILSVLVYLIFFTFTVTFAELLWLPESSKWCSEYGNQINIEYPNPDYILDPCRYERTYYLLYLTPEECDLCRRCLVSVLLGGSIGYERRSSDRPAGIRTMGLVSLGSCFFTICSMLAFKSSTQTWDSSRVTAAIPSGVGFLGAGLIWKGTVHTGTEEMHQVHGLTTAASVWLSASIGVGAGAGMYFNSVFTVIVIIFILRFGPKNYLQEYEDHDDDDLNNDSTLKRGSVKGAPNLHN